VHLVDQIDAILPAGREEADILPQVADLFDAIVARAVDFEDIEAVAAGNFAAGIAFAARILGRAFDAIERLGKNAGGGRFAHPARSDKKISVGQPVALHRIAQGAHHGVLTEDLFESLRTVFAGENLVAHGREQ
jgi:hypothetical protein